LSRDNDTVIDEGLVREFADTMLTVYNRTSMLRRIATLTNYTGQVNEFFQIGTRTYLPMKFFERGDTVYNNQVIAGEFAWSVVSAEVKFVIDKLASEPAISSVTIPSFSYPELVSTILQRIQNPTCIMIPIESAYYSQVSDWIFARRLGHVERNGDYFLQVGDHALKIIWSSKRIPFDDIFVLDNNGIRVIQKQFDNINAPIGLQRLLYTYGQETPLRLDFGQSDQVDQFDFYVRSVISASEITHDSVLAIRLTSEPARGSV
jgi:hypothetical protein